MTLINQTSNVNLTSLSGLKEVNIEKVHVVSLWFHGDGIDVVVVVRAVCAPQVDLRAVCAVRRRIRAVCAFCITSSCAQCVLLDVEITCSVRFL